MVSVSRQVKKPVHTLVSSSMKWGQDSVTHTHTHPTGSYTNTYVYTPRQPHSYLKNWFFFPFKGCKWLQAKVHPTPNSGFQYIYQIDFELTILFLGFLMWPIQEECTTLILLYYSCWCICVHMHVCGIVHVCVHAHRGQRITLGDVPLEAIHLLFEAGCFISLELHQIS